MILAISVTITIITVYARLYDCEPVRRAPVHMAHFDLLQKSFLLAGNHSQSCASRASAVFLILHKTYIHTHFQLGSFLIGLVSNWARF